MRFSHWSCGYEQQRRGHVRRAYFLERILRTLKTEHGLQRAFPAPLEKKNH